MYFLVFRFVSGVIPMQEGEKKVLHTHSHDAKKNFLCSDVNILTIAFARISKKSFCYIIKK